MELCAFDVNVHTHLELMILTFLDQFAALNLHSNKFISDQSTEGKCGNLMWSFRVRCTSYINESVFSWEKILWTVLEIQLDMTDP